MPTTKDAAREGWAARPRVWPAVLAWALLALELLLFATFPWLDHLIRQAGRPDLGTLGPFGIPPTVAALTAGTVGAVLASRRPRHPVGWLLLAQGTVMAISGACVGYIIYGLVVRPGALPAANIAARIYPVTIAAVLAAVGFVLLLTATGSPPSARWRWWARVSAVAVAVTLPVATIAPGSLDPLLQFVSGPMDPQVYGGALRVANQVALLVGVLTVLAGAASLVVRFRHARGIERQQLQWVALAAALTGLSILRYRLYDVDRIVSRTLGYGLLTVLLGLGYTGVVLGLGRLLPDSSTLAVAAATLAMAAIFQPARRRIQAGVDRRFNRRRHDAARVIEAFGARLRGQVDLDTLTAEVLTVAAQTMQPTRAWLWQRPPPTPAGR